ncbi:MAG: hypothetical protein P1R74_01185 [Sedimenticola sp.]|nr:hypothetical protein [Sedimenticola sp.]
MNKAILLIVWLWLLSTSFADSTNWHSVAEDVIKHIDEVEVAYLKNRPIEAKKAVVSAYFGVFEDRKMEAAMRTELGAKHTYQVERLFGDLRKAVQKSQASAEVSGIAESIRIAMRRDGAALDKAGIPMAVFQVNQ